MPVRTKMPAPMMQPMPRKTRFHGPERALELAGRGFLLDLLDALAQHDARQKVRVSVPRWPFDIPFEAIGVIGAEPSRLQTAQGNPRIGERSPRQHRPERPAAEDVDVEVRHFLAAVRADIGEQPIAGRDQPCVARDLADGADEAGDLGVATRVAEKSSHET